MMSPESAKSEARTGLKRSDVLRLPGDSRLHRDGREPQSFHGCSLRAESRDSAFPATPRPRRPRHSMPYFGLSKPASRAEWPSRCPVPPLAGLSGIELYGKSPLPVRIQLLLGGQSYNEQPLIAGELNPSRPHQAADLSRRGQASAKLAKEESQRSGGGEDGDCRDASRKGQNRADRGDRR